MSEKMADTQAKARIAQLEEQLRILQNKAEEALKSGEEKYYTALEASPDPFVVYDIKGRIVYFNPAFTKVFGWRLTERIGKKMDLFIPEENWPETHMMINKVLAGESFSNVETRRYTQSGHIVTVSISGAVLKDPGGQPVGSVINLRDISQQKRLEKKLQEDERLKAIGTLAGGIAHDFNNLLMGIQGRIALMRMRTQPEHPNRGHLDNIEKYIQHASELTSQLLGFARGGKYEVRAVDLNDVIQKTTEMFGRTRKEISMIAKLHQGLWAVEADQTQIEQVLLNLYLNAWQAMPGTGEIRIRTANVMLEKHRFPATMMEPGPCVHLAIADNGQGMDEATRLRIFEPFFTTQQMGRGTGLGLASVYGIIKNHGGSIEVSSTPGQGTVFDIYLPASQEPVSPEAGETGDVLKGTGTVLLVDDEDIIIDLGPHLLTELGYDVLTARSGREALRIFKENSAKIEVVILDMIMPVMDGGETFQGLKQIRKDVKVILSSGYSLEGRAAEIMAQGCRGFLQKPFTLEELSRKIREATSK